MATINNKKGKAWSKSLRIKASTKCINVNVVNCLGTSFVQNTFFCAQHKKETHTGLEQVEGE